MKIIKNVFLFILLLNGPILFASDRQKEAAHEYYSHAINAFEKNNWNSVIANCKEIIEKYPDSSFTKEALFYLGVAYFNLKDYEISNRYFTQYLKDDFNPKYFEETMHYKYSIAQNFKKGAKKRLFGWNKGPKVIVADDDAIALYEEVIASTPTHDLAAKSLFAKGQLLADFEEYKESISTFEHLIDRFEKHELSIESFIEIGKIYLKQTTYKRQDPDLLDLAELNLKKFKESFSLEKEKINELEQIVLQMKEKFAVGLLEIAQFYEKTNKKEAALIYYTKILNSFSDTKTSQIAQKRFNKLNEK